MTDLKNLYSQELVQKAFQKLQSQRITGDASEEELWTILEGPELISHEFLLDFLAFTYMMASDKTNKGTKIMGEYGGVIVTEGIQRILAVSQPSLNKIFAGFDTINEAETQDDDSLISQLETAIEMPLSYRNGITVVSGNRNVAHYDFTTSVYRSDPTDILATNLYLLLAATGFTVLSNKHLPNEQYVFGIPANGKVFDVLSSGEGPSERSNKIVQLKDSIIPEDFVAGFHIIYEGKTVKVRPLIVDIDFERNKEWIYQSGLEATESGLTHLGACDAYGNLTAVVEPGVLFKNV
mgnify:FL=1